MYFRLQFYTLRAIAFRGTVGTTGHQSGTARNWAEPSRAKGRPRDNISLASFTGGSNTQPLARPSTDLQTNGSYRNQSDLAHFHTNAHIRDPTQVGCAGSLQHCFRASAALPAISIDPGWVLHPLAGVLDMSGPCKQPVTIVCHAFCTLHHSTVLHVHRTWSGAIWPPPKPKDSSWGLLIASSAER